MSALKLKRMRKAENLLGLLLLPVVTYAMFRWFEYKQVFQPSSRMEVTGAELGRPWENVDFRAADGTMLNGWWFPPDATSQRSQQREFAILHCHGNAGNISHRLYTCQALLELGAGVFVFDYRGYGRSAGRPSEEGCYEDAQAAYDWLSGKGYSGRNILLFGVSLGGAVATDLARHRPVGGLILMNTFTSIPAVGSELFPWLPVKSLSTIRFDTLSKLPQVRVPLLIMHSRGDTIIRYPHGEELFAAANEPKIFWEIHGDHNDALFEDRERFVEGMRRFLATLSWVSEPPARHPLP